jgi:hypothetical protein
MVWLVSRLMSFGMKIPLMQRHYALMREKSRGKSLSGYTLS